MSDFFLFMIFLCLLMGVCTNQGGKEDPANTNTNRLRLLLSKLDSIAADKGLKTDEFLRQNTKIQTHFNRVSLTTINDLNMDKFEKKFYALIDETYQEELERKLEQIKRLEGA